MYPDWSTKDNFRQKKMRGKAPAPVGPVQPPFLHPATMAPHGYYLPASQILGNANQVNGPTAPVPTLWYNTQMMPVLTNQPPQANHSASLVQPPVYTPPTNQLPTYVITMVPPSDQAALQQSTHQHPQYLTHQHPQLLTQQHPQYLTHQHPQRLTQQHPQYLTHQHPQLLTQQHPQYLTHQHPQRLTQQHPQYLTHQHPQLLTQQQPQRLTQQQPQHLTQQHPQSPIQQHPRQ
ncbi:uncharacterized protein LOC129412366 [Boleophthalmus pectinirostris]|uniref:uncharacterized protein LOC129412366 n=1 Tax=Boleophthalmus pectinirostris TaxID=150288 RepID=UPI00242EE43A|nr:uncharacterized protein LOC129412366 [Boleophthalmus pectinirostris]XP_055021951.1 uncharacterized protein LOC129412366 [Boleophthalmus pectinirostris]